MNVCNGSMGKSKTCKFFVVEDKCNPIIGLNDSIALQLLSVNAPFTDKWTGNVHSKRFNSRCDEMETEEIGQQKGQLTHDYILKKYAKLFKGIGRFQCTPAKIQLKSNAVAVQKPARRIPVALKDEFQKEMNTMVKDGILTKLDKNQATEWLNSFVVVRKPSGKLRICLDPTDLNPHIIRPVCNSNTLDDVVHKLRKAKYYAVSDAIKSFFHVPLDDKSKLLTAMLTPLGVFIHNVLAMGLSNVNDIFEQCL